MNLAEELFALSVRDPAGAPGWQRRRRDMSKEAGSRGRPGGPDTPQAAPTAHRVGAGSPSPRTRERAGGHRVPGPDRPVAFIDPSLCDRLATCPVRAICPKDAVVAAPGSPKAKTQRRWFGQRAEPEAPASWQIDEDRCTGCLLCAQYCHNGAVVPGTRSKTG